MANNEYPRRHSRGSSLSPETDEHKPDKVIRRLSMRVRPKSMDKTNEGSNPQSGTGFQELP